MIYVGGNTYTVMIYNNSILDFPNPRKVKVDVVNNWLYKASAPTLGNSSKEESNPDLSNHGACNAMDEDIVPPPTYPTQHEVETSHDNKDRWGWV